MAQLPPEWAQSLTFMQKPPGLSTYMGRTDGVAQSLGLLCAVPKALCRCAPVTVKATVGLHLLGTAQATEILNAVHGHLHMVYLFLLTPQEPAVVIMNGHNKGVFAWVTTNYLLDMIHTDSLGTVVPYGVLDLGGASMQIMFEPVFHHPRQHDVAVAVTLQKNEHRYELSFGRSEHVLYQHSYLGYRLMCARKRVHGLGKRSRSRRQAWR